MWRAGIIFYARDSLLSGLYWALVWFQKVAVVNSNSNLDHNLVYIWLGMLLGLQLSLPGADWHRSSQQNQILSDE